MPDLRYLLDKDAISQVVLRYATACDTRDWPLYASCFTDPLTRDFSSFSPDVLGEISAADWASSVSLTLPGFDATQHNSTNHVHEIDGDSATCVSYMTAEHIFIEGGISDTVTLGGHYTNTLTRTDAGWKISHCKLDITWSRGNMGLFEKAVLRVQERGLAWKP